MSNGSKLIRVFAALLIVSAAVPRLRAFDPPPTLSSSVTNKGWGAQDGLPDQSIQAFAQTADGYLWIATKGGPLRFDGAQFAIFDHANTPGLSESSINCLLAERNGRHWIGTEGGGLYEYHSGRFRAIPRVDGQSDSFIHVFFRDNLPSGTYRLLAQAFEASAPSAVTETSLGIIQRPYFYETTWLALICVLAAAVALAAVHSLRARQVAMRFHAVMDERNRLARELHDTLIQDCVGVSTVLEAISKLGFDDKALCHELIDHARQQVGVTIDEARSAVWDLRHNSVQSEAVSLQGAIEEMARQMENRFGLPVRYGLVGKAYELPSSAAHEVVMIVREALANAAQHSRASQVHVRLRYSSDGLSVQIEDDGIGFDEANCRVEANSFHYGLCGMKERADKAGGVLSLKSKLGAGAAVNVWLPRDLCEVADVQERRL